MSARCRFVRVCRSENRILCKL